MERIKEVILELPLPTPMYRKWASDFTDNSNVKHKKGEIVINSRGEPIEVISIWILCLKVLDLETGEYCWLQGWSPEERKEKLMSILDKFFVPIESYSDSK